MDTDSGTVYMCVCVCLPEYVMNNSDLTIKLSYTASSAACPESSTQVFPVDPILYANKEEYPTIPL